MTTTTLFTLAGAGLFALGLGGLGLCRGILRRIMALNVMGSGVFLLLVSIAGRHPEPFADPVPHAMVLTGIVVTTGTTAFALHLARRLRNRDDPTRGRAS